MNLALGDGHSSSEEIDITPNMPFSIQFPLYGLAAANKFALVNLV